MTEPDLDRDVPVTATASMMRTDICRFAGPAGISAAGLSYFAGPNVATSINGESLVRSQSYDRYGIGYQQTRRADPRIAAQLWTAIRVGNGVGNSVLNVGAGTGSYEPATTHLAVEPSREMISQRPSSAAPAVLARAEQLPVASNVVDVALAVFTVHHWSDVAADYARWLEWPGGGSSYSTGMWRYSVGFGCLRNIFLPRRRPTQSWRSPALNLSAG